MAVERARATATIVSAVGPKASGRVGEPEAFWWEDAASYVFGKERWELELEVRAVNQPPYRVRGRWRVPNRLWKIHKALDGPRRLFPGIVLPVLISATDPASLVIDWKTFKASGADAQLYPETGSVRNAVAAMVTDFRTAPAQHQHEPRPAAPRPTVATHPPIEGVDYEQWIASFVGILRNKVRRRDLGAYYVSRGFPVGRGAAISAAWYERAKSDPVVRTWYVYDCDHLDRS